MKKNGIYGELRLPKNEIIYPHYLKDYKKIETTHLENGYKLKIDIYNLMFSQGNLFEKKRISFFGKNETIVDMFSGIGYFSIPIAFYSKPNVIYSIELNPLSYYYLCENIKINHLENIIIPIFGNCKTNKFINTADRVIMGYIGNTKNYLEYGIKFIKRSGGILHYHDTTLLKYYPLKQIELINREAKKQNKKVAITNVRIIKKYSPKVVHIVIDAYIKE